MAYCDAACQSKVRKFCKISLKNAKKDWKSVHRWNCAARFFHQKNGVVDDVGGAINDFGLSVLATMDRNVRKKDSPQCVLISPLSISIALAMLAEGAIGETRDEIVRWIDPDGEISKLDLDTLMPKVHFFKFAKYLKIVQGAGSIANSIWLKHKGTAQYEEILRKKYGAEMFYRISASEINAWAEKNTDGMIKVCFAKISDARFLKLKIKR